MHSNAQILDATWFPVVQKRLEAGRVAASCNCHSSSCRHCQGPFRGRPFARDRADSGKSQIPGSDRAIDKLPPHDGRCSRAPSPEPEIKEFTRLQASLYIDQNGKANRPALTDDRSVPWLSAGVSLRLHTLKWVDTSQFGDCRTLGQV